MKNCSVEKLNYEFNDDSLKIFGTLKIPVKPYSDQYTALRIITPNAKDCSINVYLPNGTLVETIQSYATQDNGPVLGLKDTGGYYEVDNKYAIIDGLWSNIFIDGRDNLPDIEEFLYTSELKSLSYKFAKGSITDAAKIDSLTYLEAGYFTGEILDYVAIRKQRSGSNSGEIDFVIYTTNGYPTFMPTFNGKEISSNSWGYGEKLNWNGNKVYVLCPPNNKAWTYGYTDEEIVTMKGAGGVFENISTIVKVD